MTTYGALIQEILKSKKQYHEDFPPEESELISISEKKYFIAMVRKKNSNSKYLWIKAYN